MIGAAGVAPTIVVGALVPVALHSGGTPAARQTAAVGVRSAAGVRPASLRRPRSVPRLPTSSSASTVALIRWHGTQPPGYEVNWMPSGWVVQGSTSFALVIAPPGDTNTNSDNFLGKLVVMLQSSSVTSPPTGQSQPVNGRSGVFQPYQDGIESLTFQIADGQWVVVQSPQVLGWDPAQLAQFAGGVQVLATAQQGVG
jgi:hypothetical protein